MPGTSSQEASAGLARAPPAGGERTEVEALPSHHRVKLVPTGQREGSLWEEAGWRVLSKCWGGAREGRRLGVGAEAGVRTSRRRYRHSDGSRRCCARRCRSHKARARQARPRTQRERNAPGEATHLAITFRLTEAYTGARAGGSHPPTPLPETHSLCLKVHESSRQPGWICRGPWLSRSSLIGGPG